MFYYVLKQSVRKYRIEQIRERIWYKLYTDERILFESRLRNALGELESQKIQWLICHSRNHPEIKIQFIYSVPEKKIQIDMNKEYLSNKLFKTVGSLGGVRHENKDNINSFFLPVNAKIAVDLIFLCFRQITGQEKVLNISIKTSGA